MLSKKLRICFLLSLLLILVLPLIYTCDNDSVCPPPSSNNADCEIIPVNLDFGEVVVGTHLDKSFVIANNSGDTLNGNVNESCDEYHIISGGGSFSLASHDIWPVTVRFEPTSVGLRECIIETGCDLCSEMFCTGTAESPPNCQITPSSLDFGQVTSGHYRELAFTIKNNGNGNITGNVSESCSYYSIVTGSGLYNLGASDSVVVTVRFEPTSQGIWDCTVETGNVLCSNVPCTGEATFPDPGMPDTVRVESLDLPLGTTEFDLRVYLYNDENLDGFSIPIDWTSPDLTCEAVDFLGSRVDYLGTKIATIDNPNQRVLVGAIVFFESSIPPGSGLIFTLRFSVDPSAAQQVVIADKTFYPPVGTLTLSLPTGFGFVPQFVPGTVNLGNAPPGTFTTERIQ
jgi:hypothetical protein